MPQYQGIVVFAGGLNGWTEKYYLLASSASGAAANLLAVIAERLTFLHSLCSVQTAFISDVAIRGDSIQIVGAVEPGGYTDATGFVDLDIALLVRYQVGVFSRNKTYLRGLPASTLVNGVWVFGSSFTTILGIFFAAVQTNCVMPVTTRNPTPPPNYIPASYAAIAGFQTNPRPARRKSGRPFGLPRGRRVAP